MVENYELLGLSAQATDEEITERYNQLRDKYREDRWLDGEAGNEAARMLTKIEIAYKEIMASRKEKSENTEGKDSFEEISALLKQNKISEAQDLLDNFNERNAEWHYLQAVVYYKKNWTNDSKKQLEIAMEMDPENVKYRAAYGKMNAKNEYKEQPAYQQNQNPYANGSPTDNGNQMGGNACTDCLTCCYMNLCCNCMLNACCPCNG